MFFNYIHNENFTIWTILHVWFSDVRCVQILVQSSSRNFSSQKTEALAIKQYSIFFYQPLAKVFYFLFLWVWLLYIPHINELYNIDSETGFFCVCEYVVMWSQCVAQADLELLVLRWSSLAFHVFGTSSACHCTQLYFISLSVVSLRFSHIVPYIRISFLFKTE